LVSPEHLEAGFRSGGIEIARQLLHLIDTTLIGALYWIKL